MLVVLLQAYGADRQSRLSIISADVLPQAEAAIEVNLQAVLAALSQVLCNYKKRTYARQHRWSFRVSRKKVPSPVVAFAELKAAQR